MNGCFSVSKDWRVKMETAEVDVRNRINRNYFHGWS